MRPTTRFFSIQAGIFLYSALAFAGGGHRWEFDVVARSGDVIDGKTVEFFFEREQWGAMAVNEILISARIGSTCSYRRLS